MRLYLKNFMQYSECEMLPGPTLNVIIGPNGSGKSSVVNGLALALGSKTNVLGRYVQSCMSFTEKNRLSKNFR